MSDTDASGIGMPCWLDLASPDLAASAAFYGELFGWTLADQGAEHGNYAAFLKDGRVVGGLAPVTMEDQPVAWTPYLAVDSADGAEERVRDAGGLVYVEPMDVGRGGRLAVLADAEGAAFGVWQAAPERETEMMKDAPGSLCWIELWARDTDSASVFYSEVFDWDATQSETETTRTYVDWSLGAGTFGGMVAMPAELPEGTEAQWVVYFAVEDADAVVARAEELGGRVVVAATDIPPGRYAVLADPHGAAFAVIALHEG